MSGNGYVALTGDNTFSSVAIGASSNDTGTLAVGANGLGGAAVTFGGPCTLQALDDLTLPSAIVTTYAVTIDTSGYAVAMPNGVSGANNLVKVGDGTLDMSGADNSDFTGNIVAQGGFVAADDSDCLGGSGSALVFNGGGLQWTGPFNIPSGKEIDVLAGGATFDVNGNTVTINSVIGSTSNGDEGGITVMDSSSGASGVLTLAAANIYQGGTDIESGTLQADNASAFGSGALTVNDGTLDFNGYSMTVSSLSGSGGTITNNATSTTSTLTVDQGSDTTDYCYFGNIQDGAGTIALATAGSGTLTLAGASNYSGSTTIDVDSTLTVCDGCLPSANVTDNGLLAFDISGSPDFSVAIVGSGGVSMIGPGTLELSGSNSYAGETDIESGMLQLASGATLGSGDLIVNDGILDMNGNSITVASLSGNGGTITNNAASTTSTLTVADDSSATPAYQGNIQDGTGTVALTVAGSGILTLSGTNTYSSVTLVTSGTLVVTSNDSFSCNSTLIIGDPAAFAGGPTLDVQSPVSGRGASSPPAAAVPITTVTTTPAASPAWWTTISTNTRYGQMLYFANAADTTLADMLAPADIGNHTSGEVLTALTTIFDIVLADIANNGGVRDNSQAAITTATSQIFTQYDYVVTPYAASEVATFLTNAQNFFAPGYGEMLFLTILQYMANNGTSGG